MKKQQFLQTLKDSPYSDSLIDQWMTTFDDDQMTNQYLQAVQQNNKEWARVKPYITIDQFVNTLYRDYQNQGLPHGLIIPLMICSCPSIRNTFIASEALKNVKVHQQNGMTIIDMSN